MSRFNTVETSLPEGGVPATGQFTPAVNVVPNTFNTPTSVTDSPYNTIYIGDASSNIVGTANTPYLPVALPAYIPTLYENMYYVQNNLKNVIPLTDISNNREYPTMYAVKNYVATQLQGSEYLIPVAATNKIISTGLITSFLAADDTSSSPNVSPFISGGVTTFVTTYNVNAIDSARSGAEKVCISATNLGLQGGGTNANFVMQIFLNNADQTFIVNGQPNNCYVFAGLGDTLNMYQFINPSPAVGAPSQLFFVVSYGGLFSNNVEPYYPGPTP